MNARESRSHAGRALAGLREELDPRGAIWQMEDERRSAGN